MKASYEAYTVIIVTVLECISGCLLHTPKGLEGGILPIKSCDNFM